MSTLDRCIYGVVLRIHPADFREEFGREMALDFEDALRECGFVPLLADALLSLARQWTAWVFFTREPEQQVAGHPFLAGQYFMVDRGHLTLFDWASASLLSVLLVFTIGFAASIPNRHAIASVQTVRVSHDGGIDTGGNSPPVAGDRVSRERRDFDSYPAVSGTGVGPIHGRVYLGRGRGAESPGWGPRASGGPHARPITLTEALAQLTLISVIVWLTSLFLRRSAGIGRRAALATLGLLAVAASVAFGQAPVAGASAQPAALKVPPLEVVSVRPHSGVCNRSCSGDFRQLTIRNQSNMTYYD